MFTAFAITHIVFFAVGLIAGWLAKHFHVGVPSATLGAVRSFLSDKQKADLAEIVSGFKKGEQLPQP